MKKNSLLYAWETLWSWISWEVPKAENELEFIDICGEINFWGFLCKKNKFAVFFWMVWRNVYGFLRFFEIKFCDDLRLWREFCVGYLCCLLWDLNKKWPLEKFSIEICIFTFFCGWTFKLLMFFPYIDLKLYVILYFI